MNTVIDRCVESYERHKRLKSVGDELGMPWQTVYVYLKKAGVHVVGDKSQYGSETDRLASKAEVYFQNLVPSAIDQNRKRFQSKIDFLVNGYGVDIKASSRNLSSKKCKNLRWSFSLKKQELLADFFICFGYADVNDIPIHTFLIPLEIAKHYTTMSVSDSAIKGKWWEYKVNSHDLRNFFDSLPSKISER